MAPYVVRCAAQEKRNSSCPACLGIILVIIVLIIEFPAANNKSCSDPVGDEPQAAATCCTAEGKKEMAISMTIISMTIMRN